MAHQFTPILVANDRTDSCYSCLKPESDPIHQVLSPSTIATPKESLPYVPALLAKLRPINSHFSLLVLTVEEQSISIIVTPDERDTLRSFGIPVETELQSELS